MKPKRTANGRVVAKIGKMEIKANGKVKAKSGETTISGLRKEIKSGIVAVTGKAFMMTGKAKKKVKTKNES